MEKFSLSFFGGVGTTTGANILLQFGEHKILIDCGLEQGAKGADKNNAEKFRYNPANIEYLLVTHAHIDHIGRIPKLIKEGFSGKIISTKETKELAYPMLHDALKVMRARHAQELYNEYDIEKSFSIWEGKNYNDKLNLFEGCSVKMINAGHILGSAIFVVDCNGEKIAFTGDLGNTPSPFLPDNDVPYGVEYLVMESVYGDRNHESKEERRIKLKSAILGGLKRGGTIVIPAFSIERTQIILYEINNMVEDGEIPEIPVFLDSPLAEKVTQIYRKYENDFKESVRAEIKSGDDIFDFPKLKIVKKNSESAQIESTKGPKIIIAGSGMSEGGRVVSHEARILSHPENTLILVGYQSVGTLGRMLHDGIKEVKINGEKIRVRAKIESIMGYSSHKDSDHLLEFVEKVVGSEATEDGESSRTMNNAPQPPLTTRGGAGRLKKVFVIMGEPRSSLFLTQRIHDYLDIDAIYPEMGKEYKL